MFNGDGCYKDLVSLSTSSVNLANNVFDLLQGLEIGAVIKNRWLDDEKTKGPKEYFTVLLTKVAHHNRFIKRIGRTEFINKESKGSLYLTKSNFQLLRIRKISSMPYEGYVYNIGVDKDNSYLCENIAVHNCLPAQQCMALGVPILITNFSGCQDFANHNTATLLEPEGFVMHQCLDSIPQYRHKKWAFISVKQIKEKMRYMLNNKDSTMKKTECGIELVRNRFNYERVASDFIKAIDCVSCQN